MANIKVPPSRYLESYAGQKLVMVNVEDLEEWDAAIRPVELPLPDGEGKPTCGVLYQRAVTDNCKSESERQQFSAGFIHGQAGCDKLECTLRQLRFALARLEEIRNECKRCEGATFNQLANSILAILERKAP